MNIPYETSHKPRRKAYLSMESKTRVGGEDTAPFIGEAEYSGTKRTKCSKGPIKKPQTDRNRDKNKMALLTLIEKDEEKRTLTRLTL